MWHTRRAPSASRAFVLCAALLCTAGFSGGLSASAAIVQRHSRSAGFASQAATRGRSRQTKGSGVLGRALRRQVRSRHSKVLHCAVGRLPSRTAATNHVRGQRAGQERYTPPSVTCLAQWRREGSTAQDALLPPRERVADAGRLSVCVCVCVCPLLAGSPDSVWFRSTRSGPCHQSSSCQCSLVSLEHQAWWQGETVDLVGGAHVFLPACLSVCLPACLPAYLLCRVYKEQDG